MACTLHTTPHKDFHHPLTKEINKIEVLLKHIPAPYKQRFASYIRHELAVLSSLTNETDVRKKLADIQKNVDLARALACTLSEKSRTLLQYNATSLPPNHPLYHDKTQYNTIALITLGLATLVSIITILTSKFSNNLAENFMHGSGKAAAESANKRAKNLIKQLKEAGFSCL